ncbi:isoamyl alcohol oxidase [Fusarium langsethiae]|uniref:Isoamyl alcohol oxidase n=1 Tax=Fusarium langsethiae TaxID=179993 RepID=A0A0N0V5L2_FUSLA|nr:isoamyl alcohol oxidase [Fusarium langsethiae]
MGLLNLLNGANPLIVVLYLVISLALVHSAPNTLTIRHRANHARRRRILSLAFSDSRMLSYQNIVLRHVNALCDNLEEVARREGGGSVNMSLQSDYFTFDVMSEVIFGMTYNALRDSKYRFVSRALEASNIRISALVQSSLLVIGRLDKYLFPKSIVGRNKFLGFIGSLLRDRSKASFADNGNVFSFLETAKDPDGGNELSKSEIRAECATLVVAGSDTSSSTLAGTLFYLSRNPRAYDRVCREVRSEFQDAQHISIGPKLSSCVYLRACIEETLRLSPPVGGALWREIGPGGMNVGSLSLPAGIDVGTGIYSLHHNSTYHPDPFKYLPERWIVGEGSTTSKSVEVARSAFSPFSRGPRSCVGKGFAYHELSLTIAHIIHRFEFSTIEDDISSRRCSEGPGAWCSLAATSCKCAPEQPCWPSSREWTRFNVSISGKLIETSPVAEPCYPGPDNDDEACLVVRNNWSSATFQLSQPLGYAYPLNESCPLLNPGDEATNAKCSLGHSPIYAVNVTTEQDITRSIQFAREKNLRLVIKSTGHDAMQRSTGYGSLSIWLHNFRKGFHFHKDNPVLSVCPTAKWKGSTLTINGVYAWSDIYPEAQKQGVIVLGGLNVGPSSTGGWTQGGGHGPATRYFGMGADQVVSARVVLASGKVAVANACENKDLFYAIRGGGGGTYGVVTEVTVKTYPTAQISTIDLVVGSTGEAAVSKFLDAVATVYSLLPELSRLGFAGYGNWVARSPIPIGATTYTNLYGQSFTLLGATQQEAIKLFEPFREEISKYNKSGTGLEVTVTPSAHKDYWAYYFSRRDNDVPVGGVSALASRLLDTEALRGSQQDLRDALETISGGSPVFHTIVHHGLEAASDVKADPTSAVQPGWYRSIILDIFELQMNGTQVQSNLETFAYLRNEIVPVYEKLSPRTGTYMNEADWGNVNWKNDFFGSNWERLSQVKAKYDPEGVFYCPHCVGSDGWIEGKRGLCRVG